MFDALTNSFSTAIKKIRFKDDEKSLKKALTELKKSLLKAEVHHKVVKTLLEAVEFKTKELGIGKRCFLKSYRRRTYKSFKYKRKQNRLYFFK